MKTTVIEVPNLLGGSYQIIENYYSIINGVTPSDQYMFDMRSVNFVRPYGASALVITARILAILSGQPVRLQNLDDKIHLYLKRMNIFDIGSEWLFPNKDLNDEWDRNPQTSNLLELTTITGSDSVTTIVSSAERIFSRWLRIPNLGNLLSVLSELCANVYQHSEDPHGFVMIQKYESQLQGQAHICLAVGDIGCGIRGSLTSRHGEIGQEPLDYIYAVMQGRTARATGRGGLGLRRVEQIASSEGGHLWLRSETAAIVSRGLGSVEGHRNLNPIPGTQVAVEFHAPLPA